MTPSKLAVPQWKGWEETRGSTGTEKPAFRQLRAYAVIIIVPEFVLPLPAEHNSVHPMVQWQIAVKSEL